MPVEYCVDEFLCGYEGYRMSEQIDKKIHLLYDFCILTMHKNKADAREWRVRELFESCKTETQLDNLVHDIITGRHTLNELLKRKGF